MGFEWNETGLPAAEEVIYQNRYRTLEYYSHTEAEIAEISLLQKSADWAYEREWRSVAKPEVEYHSLFMPDEHYERELKDLRSKPNHSLDYHEKELVKKFTFLVRNVKVEGSGSKAFHQSSLKEVVFGMRMNHVEVKSQIRMIEDLGFKPKFFMAHKNPNRYQLDINEIRRSSTLP